MVGQDNQRSTMKLIHQIASITALCLLVSIQSSRGAAVESEASPVIHPGELSFTVTSSTVFEDTNLSVTVLRTGGSDGAVSVDFAAMGGTAAADSDYAVKAGTLSFADGETNKTFVVSILIDQIVEGSEIFELSLSNPTGGAVLGSSNAVVTVASDADDAGLRRTLLAGGAVTFATNATIHLTNTITVATDTILDAGGHEVTISGGGQVQLFIFEAGTTNTLSGLTLANGVAGTNLNGGAIANAGNLTLDNCVVTNNRTLAGRGGAIYNSGELNLVNSRFVSNSAYGGNGIDGTTNSAATGGRAGMGGAVYTRTGTLVVTNCEFLSNRSIGGDGGAGWMWQGGAPEGWDYDGGAGEGLNDFSGTGGGAGGQTQNYTLVGESWTSGGRGGGGAGFGGAIFAGAGNMFCSGTLFSNNVVQAGQGAQNGTVFGGGIFSAGITELVDCSLKDNQALGAAGVPATGAGIGSWGGTLLLSNCTVSGNQALGQETFAGSAQGAGLWCENTTATIVQSAIYGNRAIGGNGYSTRDSVGFWAGTPGATGEGGGIFLASTATMALTNVTISMNEAKGGRGIPDGPGQSGAQGGSAFGGGICNNGAVTLVNVTIASNTVTAVAETNEMFAFPVGDAKGGGIETLSHVANLTLLNTLIAGNGGTSSGPDGYGAAMSLGNNLIGNTSDLSGLVASDLKNAPANLGPLQDNGGPTLTHDFSGSSIAIDRGNSSGAPTTDQRGVLRPQGGGIDIGAVESQFSTSIPPGEFSFSTNFLSGVEGASMVITVVRANSVGDATVSFATSDGSAQAGVEYVATNGTLSFAHGESSKTFSVTILNNQQLVQDKTFLVSLADPANGVLVPPTSSTITIQDNETMLSFGSATYSADEFAGFATINVVRTGQTNNTVSVHFNTANGTADAGSDYSESSGTLIFAPGDISKAFAIPIVGDESVEGSETVSIALSNPNGTLVGLAQAVLTIQEATTGDINRDGHTDVVMQNDDGRVAAWLMDGANYITNQSMPGTYMDAGWRLIALADFNHDFTADYILRNATSVRVGRIGSTELSFTRNITPGWGYVGSGDMNRDGHPDLVWQHVDGRLMTWLLGDFTFTRAAWLRDARPAAAGWRGKGVADFNADGHADILLHHSDGRMAVWFMNETNWTSSIFLNEGKSSGPGWKIVGLNDLNDDGHADILWQHTDQRLFVRFMMQTNFIGGNFLRDGAPVKPGWRVVGVR